MSTKSNKPKYWMSLAQLSEPPTRHLAVAPTGDDSNPRSATTISRRHFLEAAGFSVTLAAMVGCGRTPTEIAMPLDEQPEGLIPGRTQTFATTCMGCSAGCGMLVSVRDGRPLKMEGMPEHPLSRGGLCAVGQALPLGLYDSQRLAEPLNDGQPTTWEEIDKAINEKLDQVDGAVRLVTPTMTSPTLRATIDGFLDQFDDAKHVVFDLVSSSAILDAHQKTHSARVLPRYRFDRAKTIVSFGADFLGSWISPTEFTAAWSSRRAPGDEMSYHAQFESRMSLTGGKADRRFRIAPTEHGIVISHLASKLAALAGNEPPDGKIDESPIADHELDDLAEKLWASRGASIVLSDSQDVAVQVLVNHLNHTLENYGKTLDIQRPSRQRQSDDDAVLALIDELKSGKVAALLVAGNDLTHNLPDRETIASAIEKVPLVISFADRENDFASLAEFVCPDHHPLEGWSDAEPVSGILGIAQPTIEPLRNTRSVVESLARWSGRTETDYEIMRGYWQKKVLPRFEPQPFGSFWDRAVHDGFVQVKSSGESAETTAEFDQQAVTLVGDSAGNDDFSLQLYSKVGMPDTRQAHNPWLQELPDPITKATWDNYVCISARAAEQLDVADGDIVRVETDAGEVTIELPALIQPGQHDRVLAIALAYGARGTDRFAKIGPQWLEARPTVDDGELVGKNAAGFLEARGGTLRYTRDRIHLSKTGEHRELARTQIYHSMDMPANVAPHGAEARQPIQETTLAEFAKDPHAGQPEVHHFDDQQLWPEDHPKTGHWWGLAIDLNRCTGCSACLVACQSENNVPVVGKDEVRRQREMHWIRIDRYYSGEGDDVDVSHQPMMCQHCDNAPCETVCPALATVHGSEGLNEQAYNRCVGTRYCANNCPYKVRRFNWFNYPHEDQFQNLVFNPDVTVRSRGVMEKCSMCVQRIESGKIESKSRGESLEDGDIQTACQQSCPAQAIVFGDMNDRTSKIRAALDDPRSYGVLEEFNFRPSVAYKRMVRNRDDANKRGGDHV